MISSSELMNRLGDVQAQLWGTVSNTVSEACNQMITFSDGLVVASTPSELQSDLNAPMLVIQYAFSNAPDRLQVILLKPESFADLASAIKGTSIDEVDDNLTIDLRPQLESLVQGMCLGVGNLLNEPIVATGISIRYQILSLPQNLARADVLGRVQVAFNASGKTGAAIWIMDGETAALILGLEEEDESEAASPFLQVQPGGTAAPHAQAHHEDPSGLGILMDIPLEISVELGRVKMVVRDVLELGNGSVVEIDKAAGEPVDVMVNGRLVARGEVVVIEDNFGVRITEICNAMERLARLNEAA